MFNTEGYALFRRNRRGHQGGGVAVYAKNHLSAQTCMPAVGHSPHYKLLWVHIQTPVHEVFVGALYHPPKPVYRTADLLDYLEMCMDALTQASPSALIILAGDFNSLDNDVIVSHTALNCIVNTPTRGSNYLDRKYVSEPCYTCLLYTSPSPRDRQKSRMPSSA